MDGFAIAGSDALLDGRFGNPFAGASHLCVSLKVLDLNTEGFLKILGAQELLPEVSVGCNLPLNAFLEGAYLLLIGAWKGSHGPLDHIKVALRSGFHLLGRGRAWITALGGCDSPPKLRRMGMVPTQTRTSTWWSRAKNHENGAHTR